MRPTATVLKSHTTLPAAPLLAKVGIKRRWQGCRPLRPRPITNDPAEVEYFIHDSHPAQRQYSAAHLLGGHAGADCPQHTRIPLRALAGPRTESVCLSIWSDSGALHHAAWLDDPKSCRPHRAHFCFHVPACWMVTPNRQHALPVRLWTKHRGPPGAFQISVSVFCERLCGGLAAHRSQRRFTPSFHRRKRGDCWRAGRLLRLLPARLYHHGHLPDFLLLDRPSARRAGAGLLVPDPVSDGLSGAGHRIRHKRRRGLVGARGRLCHRCDSGARTPPIPQTNGNPLENPLMGTTSNLSSICMD